VPIFINRGAPPRNTGSRQTLYDIVEEKQPVTAVMALWLGEKVKAIPTLEIA
jgi:hypothetical protein